MRTSIGAPLYDPSDFDLVIVGTPVWRLSVSSPIRTYLQDHARALQNVAFFCTMNYFGSNRAFRQMGDVCRRYPIATLARSKRAMRRGDLGREVDAFVDRLRNEYATLERAEPISRPVSAAPAPAK